MVQRNILIDLSISAQDYLAHYQGTARDVLATTHDGLSVRFPSSVLQKFVTHSGIHGTFRLVFNEANKLTAVERVDGARAP